MNEDKTLQLPEANLSHIFGSLKGKRKITGQQFKDLVRSGWD